VSMKKFRLSGARRISERPDKRKAKVVSRTTFAYPDSTVLSIIDSLYISMCVCARAHAVRDLREEKGYPFTLHATKQTTTTK